MQFHKAQGLLQVLIVALPGCGNVAVIEPSFLINIVKFVQPISHSIDSWIFA